MSKNTNTISSLKESIPLIYILLVCFGYFNKSLYFDKFDIDILYYLTIPELVFSFIPIGSGLILAFLFLLIVIAPYLVFTPEDNLDIENANEHEDHFNIYNKIEKIENRKIKIASKKIYWVIALISSIYLNFIPILTFLAYYILRNYVEFDAKVINVIMIFWGLIFVLKFKFLNSKRKNNPRLILFIYLIIAVIIFFVYTERRMKDAEEILNGKSKYSIKLINEINQIKTDSELLYIGQSNNFIFLRNIKINETIVFKKQDFQQIIISKQIK